MNKNYENLANAIVLQAAMDFRKALKTLKKYPCDRLALHTKREVMRFFRSDWYSSLTTVDPEILIHKLTEEVLG